MRRWTAEVLYEEMAFLAMHLNWSHAELMAMEHGERRRWCREISAINRARSGAPANPFEL